MDGLVRVTEIGLPVDVCGTDPSGDTHETTTERTELDAPEIRANCVVASVSKLIEIAVVLGRAFAGIETDAPLDPTVALTV